MSQHKPQQGYSLNYLIDTLEVLDKKKTYTQFFNDSMIKHKATFFKYINWLVKKKYINRTKGSMKQMVNRPGRFSESYEATIAVTFYRITTLGRMFLSMIV